MYKTLGIRSLVVAAGAAMLLVLGAACTKEVEVPGETVIVEKEVVKTVEVPGETIVVEKEVVKTVEVPGETIVVEKEVVKEVPGETVVVTKEVVREVPGKNYVTDPTTGKVVSAPEYGGTLTLVRQFLGENIDPYFSYTGGGFISGVNERLGLTDWGIDRDLVDYRSTFAPEDAIIGKLAESWDISPDGLTYTFEIRQGVYWHNKAPMNGRELTAQDIEYNLQRLLGNTLTGTQFSEAEPYHEAWGIVTVPMESITATDKWTLVIRLTEPSLPALGLILKGRHSFILAPEVIEQYGDVTDWRNVVGTGPWMVTDHVEGSSVTYTKNPDYWGFDEKYPQNRLPYIDELRLLISKDKATHLALMRSGKADYLGLGSDLQTIDAQVSLQRTNPEFNFWDWSYRAETSFAMNMELPLFNDIRVRHAMQMAIDFETINQTYFKGWANMTPAGKVGKTVIGYFTPFEEWPEELKQYYRYDPEGAEALLDQAGYPRGADGVRFSTVYEHYEFFDFDYYQIIMEYLRAIGIDVEVKQNDRAAHIAAVQGGKQQGLISEVMNHDSLPTAGIRQAYSTGGWVPGNVNDPVYDAMFEAAEAATTIEDQKRLVKEADMYIIEKHWWIVGPRTPKFIVAQPWLIGYNGEIGLAGHEIFARVWIDQELKEAMGR